MYCVNLTKRQINASLLLCGHIHYVGRLLRVYQSYSHGGHVAFSGVMELESYLPMRGVRNYWIKMSTFLNKMWC